MRGEKMFEFNVLGINVEVSISIVCMWAVMSVLIIFSLVVYYFVKSGRFKTIPDSKFQIAIEGFIEFIYKQVEENMGKRNLFLAPYIGSLGLLVLACNLSGLFAIPKIPTSDYSVTLGLAISTFLFVQFNLLRVHKVKGYFMELFEPIPALFPLKILEKFTPVLSMSLRLFCNMAAGYIVMELIYGSLKGISLPFLKNVPVFMTFFPVPLHFYFDVFDSVIQTVVFVMLTMVLTAIATEGGHEEPKTATANTAH